MFVFRPAGAVVVVSCFYLTAAKQAMTPVSGEVMGCDPNSEEIKPSLFHSFDSLSKNKLTASNSQLPFSQTSEPNMSSTFQRQDDFLFLCLGVFERHKPQDICAVTKSGR